MTLSMGCGSNFTVSGKVTFPDGTPLDAGEVLFESPAMIARGEIKKDGTYVMNTGELKGMPKGTYKVSIGGFKPTYESLPPPPGGGPPPRPRVIPPVIPIDKKFLDSAKSGLTCEVNGRTKYDITVEPPM